ncbi:D-alanyl-D-alanine carboxypeptidase family protein [Siminovitchia fortis]|uniref:serine-type D-Ala-D-Ala carboxypeptidase n=1 Tax=Siminovitchia fortis TaxID=254758 RepID=A0A443J3K2_9BACI|nr:D-alanyl-D-alanine carboxypeptidase family protein [Siminovitchia fortis]RWR15019.1 D-alanyl-D-alanine carboxypeptidase [Siminovitchia fortis]WHY82845.1 D-alanyl-D-alanine carboxypeptidase family protein [Siminovitchia fortis]
MSSLKGFLVIIIISAILLSAFSQKEDPDLPVSASSAVLMEQKTGRVLFEKNPHEVRRIASITKIMTAILAIESGKMDDTVKVSRSAAYAEGSSIYLVPGEKIKLRDLVYGLMLRSGNDAANAIAEHVGGSMEGFVFMMNQKAREIGMTNTVFSNPSGLDGREKHYSTAYDMALLMRYAMHDETFRTISGTKVYSFEREDRSQHWKNKNRLLTEKYKYATGGKTGYTKRAGRTLVTTASKKDKDMIAVTLNASDDWNDHIFMYEYGFGHFKMMKILPEGPLKDVQPFKGKRTLFIEDPVYYPLMKEEYQDVRVRYRLLSPKDMRKTKDGEVGRAVIYLQDQAVRKIPVYITEEEKQEKVSWKKKLKALFFGRTGVILP